MQVELSDLVNRLSCLIFWGIVNGQGGEHIPGNLMGHQPWAIVSMFTNLTDTMVAVTNLASRCLEVSGNKTIAGLVNMFRSVK